MLEPYRGEFESESGRQVFIYFMKSNWEHVFLAASFYAPLPTETFLNQFLSPMWIYTLTLCCCRAAVASHARTGGPGHDRDTVCHLRVRSLQAQAKGTRLEPQALTLCK